ncbi:carbohydrate ABC transporter permease [Kineococcus terrestris]|uniref:carbohydrate ABC transporter permease n=1 Tax=Kineococcus terrestris TaxID=2044856 RepID=UPI0034DAD163
MTVLSAGRARGAEAPHPARPGRGARIRSATYYGTTSALAVLFLSPLVWSLFSSVHGPRASGGAGGYGVDNYRRLIEYGEGLAVYAVNSTVISVLTVAGTLVVTVLGGYAFARFQFPGKDLLFLGALAILMIPHPTILIPLYEILRTVGLQNSLVGVALVMVMFQLPFSLFMMRNAFESVPRELEEAALLDGCTSLTALLRILLRAVTPAMITVGLFAFLASWNEFIAPLIFLSEGSKFTLPVALVSLRSGELGAIDLGALQAGIVVTAIPCLLLFLLLQRYYVRGFTAGAVRG